MMDLHQTPIEYVNSQLNDFSLNPMGPTNGLGRSGTPLNSTPSLNRTSSLIDNFGIQRTQSPFYSNGVQSSLQQPGVIPWTHSSNSDFGLVNSAQSAPQDAIQFTSNMGTPSLNHASVSMTSGPPGMNFVQQPQVFNTQGIKVLWHYLDQTNSVQGPFVSELMDQWYSSGFFNEALQIMPIRSNDPFHFSDRFISFRELLDRTGAVNPFHQFDLICSNYHSKSTSYENLSSQLNATNSHTDLNNGFNTQQIQPSLLANSSTSSQLPPLRTGTQEFNSQFFTLGQASSQNGVKSLVNESVVKKGIESPDFNHAEILKLNSPDGSYYHERTVAIPASKHIQPVDSFSQNEFPTSSASSIAPTTSTSHISVHKEVNLADQSTENMEIRSKKEEDDFQNTLNEPTSKSTLKFATEIEDSISITEETSKNTMTNTSKPKPTHEEIALQLLHEEEEENRKKQLKIRKKHESNLTKETTQVGNVASSNRDNIKDETKESDVPKEKPSAWGNISETAVPAISLVEMQKRQAEEKKRKDIERERQEREEALKLQQTLLMEEEKKKNSVANVANWVSGTTQKASSMKSIEESRKEALEAKKFIEEQKRILEAIKKSKNVNQKTASSGQSTSSTSQNNFGGWTTVVKKKATQHDTNKSNPQQTQYVSPDRLRSISANPNMKTKVLQGTAISIPSLRKPKQAQSSGYMGNETTSAQQNFLNWCRSQMKLSEGVKVDSVLEMLLSLPASMESREIITDTIYANSTEMDAKTFASAFIKKRIECEDALFNPLPWSEVLSMPQANADDWEFQVVGKKKGKRY